MLNNTKKNICFSAFLFVCLSANTQTFTIEAKIDSTLILIGEQCNLTFEISQNPGLNVVTPLFSDTIIGGIEIVSRKTDTLRSQDNYLIISQNYLITSFDSALYYIPEFKFACGGDTILSNSLSLKVVSVPIITDSITQQPVVADIRGIAPPPIDWQKVMIIMLIVSLIIVVIVLFIVIYLMRRTREKIIKKIPEKIKPPQEIALEKLEEIRQAKIWQQGRNKEYYTQITDVLREYVEKRFAVPTFERTTDEIINSLQFAKKDYSEQINSLQKIFYTSNMVKFAKFIPDFNEHIRNLDKSEDFVSETVLIKEINNQQNQVSEEFLKKYKLSQLKNLHIKGLDNLDFEYIEYEISKGARFVIFTYCISIVVFTFRRPSKIYFIRHNEKAIKKGWIYMIICVLFGWWGIPFGIIYTIQAIKNAFVGKNVTREIMQINN